jgi:parvulin-like peptidyl-prolyl isomerase
VKNFLCICVAGALWFHGSASGADLVTAVAVVVNDSVITLGEIDGSVAENAKTLAKLFANDKPRLLQEYNKLHDETIEGMVEDKLILHDFVTTGYVTNVLEAFIDDRIQETIQAKYYGDRARLMRSLRAEGLTYESWRRGQREQWIIRVMKDQNSSQLNKILISPLKISQYYEAHKNEFNLQDQVKLRMIVLPQSSESAPGSAKKLAEEILAKIDSGVPFAELAAVYSTGAQRAEGGDRGWVNSTYFKPSLAKIAFSLKPGEHSGVIEEPEACYLMMVEDVKPAHVKTLLEVRDDIALKLRNQESQRLFELWIARLKRKSFVSYSIY